MDYIEYQDKVLERKNLEFKFLNYFKNHHYTVIDLHFIERLNWQQLTQDDLESMSTRSIWKNGQNFFALRNDWTDQLQHYARTFDLNFKRAVYAGPIANNEHISTNLGIEVFNPSYEDMLTSFQYMLKFIKEEMQQPVDFAVIGHYQLLNLLLSESEQTPEILQLINERNISELSKKLSEIHPLVNLLKQPTHLQLDYIPSLIPNDHPTYLSLLRWSEELKRVGIESIHLDITTMPPKSYYIGSFMQIFKNDQSEPIMSGGHYDGEIEGFGFGIKLD
ncbi:ATP phosphoribosyltransferase regulatory subunit [Staphylococcus carnosus]|uniref:ATP phosphoribosyltransferase regulatory subunit n=2 Tax=Staphylococcus carnosus TaxID=1281 RepID=B9DQ90_STACT|nr:ATP phosphoribosyltransferase regulatory subunit [Staphylococcus carnosus]QPT03720.1 ATP phosphoribosyltransferase regulatory subunit [Staphylococcus carnosus]UQA66444.1 ATP phosphoribosyltransferase regulatory subunit [Staphylococcus carnosus]UTB78725.1 ATP phosphoribosyltransferase regulatory subunit [Staphylococcus carnosus]UTB88275.1 ATP phosphoribosyltransferase regulatory subunit [Staphylococcus carnosus]UTB90627.1 ATP phosphoribosyltransferase regulatory subunit [Staphylococcus carno